MERLELQKYIESYQLSKNYEKHSLRVENPIKNHFELRNGEFDVLFDCLESNENIQFGIKENAKVHLAFFSKQELNDFNLNINVFDASELEIYFADFAFGKNNIKININLKAEGSKADFKLASLTLNQDNKVFDVSIIHEAKNTYGKVDNYGVCRDASKLLFSGTSYINKGCIQSKTFQNARIMVFDKECVATAKPILKIDENDIVANHAAVVGKVNDEHLFYLTSRGISEVEAKEIITFGYLKPILEGFSDEEIKEEITNIIEGNK